MNTKNEATVSNLLKKREEDEKKKAEEDEKKKVEEAAKKQAEEETPPFEPGQHDVFPEEALKLENVALKLELVEKRKQELEDERSRIVFEVSQRLGIPQDMKIVGGTSDFKKVLVEKREE